MGAFRRIVPVRSLSTTDITVDFARAFDLLWIQSQYLDPKVAHGRAREASEMYKHLQGLRRTPRSALATALTIGCLALGVARTSAGEQLIKIAPSWNQVATVSRSTLSIDVCVYPQIRRGDPLHDKLWRAFSGFAADYQRILFWYAYPRLTVAELYRPRDGKTFWNFALLDPIVEDFMKSAKGRPVVMDMGTVPNWIYTPTPEPIPSNPDKLVWHYYAKTPTATHTRGAPSSLPRRVAAPLSEEQVKLIAEYQARLVGWYTKGGFRDEYGVWHKSGHTYKFDYWEVLSEPDLEWGLSPQDYTRVYDATVEAVRKVNPVIKFVGLSLASPRRPDYFFYFLEPANHKPGIPLDMISLHAYSYADSDENDPVKYQHALFRQIDDYVGLLAYVKAIRDRLSPNTRISVNEVGDFLPGSFDPVLPAPIADSYWNLMAAASAYEFARMADLGIDIVNQAELLDYPGQSASTTLVDWKTGKPNARYRAMKLLRDSVAPGDKMVLSESNEERGPVFDEAFIGRDGKRRVLVVNKRDQPETVKIEGAAQGIGQVVDRTTSSAPAALKLKSGTLQLGGFAVAVITLKQTQNPSAPTGTH